jgi:hypothetical protein
MENLINKYPDGITDFSKLIKFSFNKILKYFNEKILTLKTEYFFLINVNKNLFIKNEKSNTKIIDEIIKSINNIKSNNESAKIRIFSFKKYVKELIKMKKDEKNIDQKKLMDLLIKEIDDPPQYDIILSLSDLYMKMENNLLRENEEKNKLIKFIIINKDNEKYNEKEFKIETLENVLNEFINENSCYFGVEFININNKLLQNKSKDNIVSIINKSDNLLKKGNYINKELYDKWQDINSNEDINDGIKKMDELLKFFKNVLNSIYFIKNKINNCKDEKTKNIQIQKIEDHITSQNLNNIKEGIISSDINDSYMEEINNYKKMINELEINNLISEEIQYKKDYNIIYINSISKFILNQKEIIFQFFEILEKSTLFFDSIEKEIFKQTNGIISNSNIETEKNEEEENEEEEIK